jgi:Fe-S oxidoreductase
MIDAARAEAVRSLAALAPWVERGTPIVGLEPSCLLTFRDELEALLPGAEARSVATLALTFEEFLQRHADAAGAALRLGTTGYRRALVHGHCHQKAFGVMDSVVAALGLVPDLEVELLDSGCCGMAGAFGYDAAHYDVSMRIGEETLLPAVRAAGEDTVIIADGTSCRHQIRDGTERQAHHVAWLLARALP